jgi:Adenylate and Guanylate cyclase catalytic domain
VRSFVLGFVAFGALAGHPAIAPVTPPAPKTFAPRVAKILDRIFGVFNIGPPFDPPFRFFAEEPVDRTRKSCVLDWFHITMRLTVLEQYARGVAHHDEAAGANLLTDLERIKWLLWHGNQHRAGKTIGFFLDDVDALQVDYPNLHKFARAAHEFGVYIAAPDQLCSRSQLLSAPPTFPSTLHRFLNPSKMHCDWRSWASTGLVLAISALRAKQTLSRAASLARERGNLSRYLPGPMVELLAERDITELRAGRLQPAAILFADICGFTAMSERLSPIEVATLLNSFRNRVARAIERRGGIVDKFIVDAVMGVFGLPEPGTTDARAALLAARELLGLVKNWNAERSCEGQAFGAIRSASWQSQGGHHDHQYYLTL